MKFFDLMESGFSNPELQQAWQMIQAHISSAQSYIEAGHDVRHVLAKVASQVKMELQNLEFMGGGGGNSQPKNSNRPLDQI